MKLLVLVPLVALAGAQPQMVSSSLSYQGYGYPAYSGAGFLHPGYPQLGFGGFGGYSRFGGYYGGHPHLQASYYPATAQAAHTFTTAPVAPAPRFTSAPIAPIAHVAPSPSSQFHAQDEMGNLNYGYSNVNSAKEEVGNTYTGVNGGYSYVDAADALQQVTYVADAAGFRVADSRLPVAPVYTGVAPTFNPAPLVAPVDTPTFNP